MHLNKVQFIWKKCVAMLAVISMITTSVPGVSFIFAEAAETPVSTGSSKLWEAEEGEYIPGEYIVQYEEPAEQSGGFSVLRMAAPDPSRQVEKVLKEYDAAVEDDSAESGVLVSVEETMTEKEEQAFIEKLENTKGVAFVEKNRVVKIAAVYKDTYSEEQWGPEHIRAFDAWAMMPDTAETVRVAVVDTGVDATHPDLAGRVISGYTAIDENSRGKAYDPNQSDDDHGHGTHVSGIIAAVCGNEMGIQGVMGKTPVEILPVKVLNDAGKGGTYDIIEGIRYAADHGADIISMSLGSNYPSEAEREAIVYAQNKGCLVIAASGNESVNVSTTYPASYENVISVGSVDRDDSRSYFSNYGATLDLAAPGSSILSTIPKATAMAEKAEGNTVYGNDMDGYYAAWSGTSMATPHVSAVAAMYKAANPTASNWDIGNHLVNTARDVGAIGKDPETGAGVVDAAAVLGKDIVKTAMLLLSPSNGKELYQSVNLRVQVNTSMDITHVNFYLDSVESDPIVSTSCDGAISYYDVEWDTTKAADGEHELIAVACDADGQQVGDECRANVSVLNHITDGFTLQILNPDNTAPDTADLSVYGISADGTYKKLRTIYATDLGFARVKGLDKTYETYALQISGTYSAAAKNYFAYQRTVSSDGLGDTLTIGKENITRKTTFSLIGETGTAKDNASFALESTYKKGEDSIGLETMEWQISPDSQVYLDEGVYRTYGYWAPGEIETQEAAYCLSGQSEISQESAEVVLKAEDGTKVSPVFNTDVRGTLSLSQITGQSKIPFVSGEISGASIYIMPGSYLAGADLNTFYNGRQWNLSLTKKDPVTVEDTELQVDFGTNLALETFEADSSLRTDNSTGVKFLYRGENLRTTNKLGNGLEDSDNEISNITSGYPTLNIYKLEDGERTLVYTRQDIWQLTSSQWNSAEDYIGEIPKAGQYEAELVFDAGPFGGVTKKTIPFELRNKSGVEEVDISLQMGRSVLPYASVEFYYWDEGQKNWVKSRNSEDLLRADGDGIIKGLRTDEIQLNSNGINLLLVRYDQKRTGYNAAVSYKGFQTVPFSKLSELASVQLESGVEVKAEVLDKFGNRKSVPVYFPIVSDGGGRLAEPFAVTDAELNLSSVYNSEPVYIPGGSYSYAYSLFNDGTNNYCITADAFNAVNGAKLTLDGRNTKELTVTLPSEWNGYGLYPMDGALKGFTFERGNRFLFSPGSYQPVLEMTKGDMMFRVQPQTAIDLNNKYDWKISGEFSGEIRLDSKAVAENQTLAGVVSFTDSQGNLLAGVQKKAGEAYTDYIPELILKAPGGGEKVFASSYDIIMITPDQYSGQGAYSLRLRYDFGQGTQQSETVDFTVGQQAQIIRPHTSSLYTCQYRADGAAVLTLAQGAGGFLSIGMDVLPAGEKRTIQTEVVRDGKTVVAFRSSRVFTQTNDQLYIGVNVKAGDQVVLKAE